MFDLPNGHDFMSIKQVRIGPSRPSKTDMFSVHRGPSLMKMVVQIVSRVVNYTQNVKFYIIMTKRARKDVRACIVFSISVP